MLFLVVQTPKLTPKKTFFIAKPTNKSKINYDNSKINGHGTFTMPKMIGTQIKMQSGLKPTNLSNGSRFSLTYTLDNNYKWNNNKHNPITVIFLVPPNTFKPDTSINALLKELSKCNFVYSKTNLDPNGSIKSSDSFNRNLILNSISLNYPSLEILNKYLTFSGNLYTNKTNYLEIFYRGIDRHLTLPIKVF